MGYLDLADVRTCRACGSEIFRIYDRDGIWLADADPGVVWDGSTVDYGVYFERLGHKCIALVHVGRVSPHRICVFRHHDCAPAQRLPQLPPAKGDKQVSFDNDDPFDKPDSRPSVSFKNAPIGATVTCIIDGKPNKVQARNYDTNKPDFWDDGNPKMTVATDVLVNGEPMTLWAAIPSSMFSAIRDAQNEAGAKLEKGGTLVVQFYEEKPSDNPRKAPQKLYRAKYTAPDAFASTPSQDATPAQPAAPAPQPAAAAPAPPWAMHKRR